MKNRFSVRAVLLLTAALCVNLASAQDSVRAKPRATVVSKPVAAKPAAVKPVAARPAGTATYPARPVARPGAYAQQPAVTAPVNTDKSLNGQYQYLLTKVYGYQRPPLVAFFKNVMDTIHTDRQKLRAAQGQLRTQGKAVQDLQSDVTAKQQSLDESNSKADAISLLGIPLSKGTYNLIMWGLVIFFGVAAALVIAQSGSARREAKYRIKLYDDLDNEYKVYKTKANEKEKKMARELQTVRNKLEEITGNPGY